MTTPIGRVLAALLAALLLVACGGEDATGGDPDDEPTPPAVEDAPTPGDDEGDEGDDVGLEPTTVSEPVVIDVDFEERSPNGTTVRVRQFEVTTQAIAVDVEIVVPAEQALVWLNNPTNDNEARILDDRGNEYSLVPPEGNRQLRVDGGDRLEGTLAFAGPIDLEAEWIELVFNPSTEPGARGLTDLQYPHFTFPAVDLVSGEGGVRDGERGESVVVEVDFSGRTPDNTTAAVTRLEVAELEILVDVDLSVSAERTSPVWFNNPLGDNEAKLTDDQGNTYDLVPPQGNRTLQLRPGERLEGTLSFQGPLQRGVRTLQLVFNPHSTPDSDHPDDLRYPHFTFPEVDVSGR